MKMQVRSTVKFMKPCSFIAWQVQFNLKKNWYLKGYVGEIVVVPIVVVPFQLTVGIPPLPLLCQAPIKVQKHPAIFTHSKVCFETEFLVLIHRFGTNFMSFKHLWLSYPKKSEYLFSQKLCIDIKLFI